MSNGFENHQAAFVDGPKLMHSDIYIKKKKTHKERYYTSKIFQQRHLLDFFDCGLVEHACAEVTSLATKSRTQYVSEEAKSGSWTLSEMLFVFSFFFFFRIDINTVFFCLLFFFIIVHFSSLFFFCSSCFLLLIMMLMLCLLFGVCVYDVHVHAAVTKSQCRSS